MPHVHARLPRELIIQICDRIRSYQPRKVVAIELEVCQEVVAKYTAHIPDGTKRDLVRASILKRASEAQAPDSYASA